MHRAYLWPEQHHSDTNGVLHRSYRKLRRDSINLRLTLGLAAYVDLFSAPSYPTNVGLTQTLHFILASLGYAIFYLFVCSQYSKVVWEMSNQYLGMITTGKKDI